MTPKFAFGRNALTPNVDLSDICIIYESVDLLEVPVEFAAVHMCMLMDASSKISTNIFRDFKISQNDIILSHLRDFNHFSDVCDVL